MTDSATQWGGSSSACQSRKISDLLIKAQAEDIKAISSRHEGRVDLRGFPFNTIENKEPSQLPLDENDGRLTRRARFERLCFRSFDFSGAYFDRTFWGGCVFENCLFAKSGFHSTFFYGCEFIDCIFEDCRMTYTFMKDMSKAKRTLLVRCTFNKGIFQVYFGYPTIDGCTFNCNLSELDFHGGQLSNCKFTGRLDWVRFSGKRKPDKGDVYRSIEEVPENKMENIDFSEAVFVEPWFSDGVDISDCSFPKQKYLIFVFDGPRVIPEALKIIDSEWTGEDRRLALKALSPSLNTKDGQKVFVYNLDSLASIINEIEGKRVDFPKDRLMILFSRLSK